MAQVVQAWCVDDQIVRTKPPFEQRWLGDRSGEWLNRAVCGNLPPNETLRIREGSDQNGFAVSRVGVARPVGEVVAFRCGRTAGTQHHRMRCQKALGSVFRAFTPRKRLYSHILLPLLLTRKLACMKSLRYETVDTLRGLAIVWMTVFHFFFDFNQSGPLSASLGWVPQNFYGDPFWTWQRTLIVSLFLFCAGISQAIAVHQGQSWPRFFKRWVQIVGCALFVSIGSYLLYPQSFIYFGVLHGIAVMLLIVRFTARWGRWLWVAGATVIAISLIAPQAMKIWAGAELFNQPLLNWLGLITRKPITEDYVPLLPWLGVVWWGVAAGQWLLVHRPVWLAVPAPLALRPLNWLGRWSLSWYMLHQPVMIGALMGVAWVAGLK